MKKIIIIIVVIAVLVVGGIIWYNSRKKAGMGAAGQFDKRKEVQNVISQIDPQNAHLVAKLNSSEISTVYEFIMAMSSPEGGGGVPPGTDLYNRIIAIQNKYSWRLL